MQPMFQGPLVGPETFDYFRLAAFRRVIAFLNFRAAAGGTGLFTSFANTTSSAKPFFFISACIFRVTSPRPTLPCGFHSSVSGRPDASAAYAYVAARRVLLNFWNAIAKTGCKKRVLDRCQGHYRIFYRSKLAVAMAISDRHKIFDGVVGKWDARHGAGMPKIVLANRQGPI
jgi:hypothetical protein